MKHMSFAYTEHYGAIGACATCGAVGPLYEVHATLDTDPELYDQLYAEKYCATHADHWADQCANPPASGAAAGPPQSAPGSRLVPRPT